MLDFGWGLLLHGEKKWATIKLFMFRNFLVEFLKDSPESSMDTENLMFGQIVGVEQISVRCMS